tara:strand:+ start:382 stop:591 length:210 start_codon:yes stop_codon:yes gene_type:complete
MSEGNIISFKVFLDSKGNLITEYKCLPLSQVSTLFKGIDVLLISKVIKEVDIKISGLHDKLEKELQALN